MHPRSAESGRNEPPPWRLDNRSPVVAQSVEFTHGRPRALCGTTSTDIDPDLIDAPGISHRISVRMIRRREGIPRPPIP